MFEWFKSNLLKGNTDKCHFWLVQMTVCMNVDGFKIDKSDAEKLLSVKFARKLAFDDHSSDICKKASTKISTLARVTPCMGIVKKSILMNTFFTSQFGCCPLVRMCRSRANNNK